MQHVVQQGLTDTVVFGSQFRINDAQMLFEDLPNLVSKHILGSCLWPDLQHL